MVLPVTYNRNGKNQVAKQKKRDKSYTEEEIPTEYVEKLFNDTTEEFKNLEE